MKDKRKPRSTCCTRGKMSYQEHELKRAIFGRMICISFIIFGIFFYILTLSLNVYMSNAENVEKQKKEMKIAKIVADNLALIDVLNNKNITMSIDGNSVELSVFENLLEKLTNSYDEDTQKHSDVSSGYFGIIKSFVKTENLSIMTLSYFSLISVFLTLFGIYDRRIKNILSYLSIEQRFEKLNLILIENDIVDANEIRRELMNAYMSTHLFGKNSDKNDAVTNRFMTLGNSENSGTEFR